MAFFYTEAKSAAKSKPKAVDRKVIPIASLQQLGCSVCRHDKADLLSPKMTPEGKKSAPIYLLGSAPSKDEDEANAHWVDKAGDVIYKAFGRDWMKEDIRSNFITQCRGDQTEVEIECCRPRIVADIEATKPLIVVTIGDGPFRWATGATGTVMPHRGSRFVARIGNHVCWVMPILYPNFAYKKERKSNEFELAFHHDVRAIKKFAKNAEDPLGYTKEDHTRGIEVITGQEPGDMQRLEVALKKLARENNSALDYETNGLRPHFLEDPKIWMAAVGTFEHTVVFPIDHPEGWGTEGRRRQVWRMLGDYIMESGEKAAHNLSMELEWSSYFFGDMVLRRAQWADTMAMAHTLDERSGTKGLGIQTHIHFGFNVKTLSNIDVKRILEYPIKKTLLYCGMDTKWTDLLRRRLEPIVKKENWPEYLRKLRLAPVLVRTEAKGVPADLKYAHLLADKFDDRLFAIEKKIGKLEDVQRYERRNGRFDPAKPEHVLKLMKDLGRDEVRVEDERSGAVTWTTDEEALSKIPAKEVPAAPLILEHRGVLKNRGTYITPTVTKKIICPDGRIRTKYGSMVAETGRLNSEDPNLQNWPKRKDREIRGIVYAPPGQIIAALDYGQIEFRVVGMASKDPAIVKACWTGYDVHMAWAKQLLAIYPDMEDYVLETFADVLETQRKKDGAKFDEEKAMLKLLRQDMKNMWVFPQLFGSSIASCAAQLHLPGDVADELAEEFWREFSATKEWQEELWARYQKDLYVETLGGRKRRGPMSINQVINHPIQGTAADIVLEGMCELSELSEAEDDIELQPNINIHDDLSSWLQEEGHMKKIDRMAAVMCKPRFDWVNVPLIVEASTGYRWHELKEVKVYKSHELYNTPNPYA